MTSVENRFDSGAANWDTEERIKRSEEMTSYVMDKININNRDVLDYGAGTGLAVFNFNKYARRVIAADTSTGMINIINQKIEKNNINNVEAVYFNPEEGLDIKQKVDIIYSSMVLHHIENINDTASMMHQLLNHGGEIALIDLDKEDGDFHHDNDGIMHFGFEREELGRIFEDKGFSKINFDTIYVNKKITREGIEKEFPMFLMTGIKLEGK